MVMKCNGETVLIEVCETLPFKADVPFGVNDPLEGTASKEELPD